MEKTNVDKEIIRKMLEAMKVIVEHLKELDMPGYANLYVFAILSACVMIDTANNDTTIDDQNECVDIISRVEKSLIKKLSDGEKISLIQLIKFAFNV